MSTLPLTVTIAPDSFKGTITAADAARALADGWTSERPGDRILLTPMADGGEGTLDAIAAATPDARRVPVRVQGPDDRPVTAEWLLLPGSDGRDTAVVELANTSGITLLCPLLPSDAHTLGFGQAIADALDRGVDRLVLAIGGSSSTDGGAGVLAALGARFLDAAGAAVRPGNRGLADVDRVDLSGLRPLPEGGVTVLSDVTNPLLGTAGAAAVFGPQKGATPGQVRQLNDNLAHFARLLGGDPDAPGTGAAGGAGYGLQVWGGALSAGAAAVGDVVDLPRRIAGSDIVLTGEGKFDRQSAAGKVPSYVLTCAAAAAAAGSVRTGLVAGAIDLDDPSSPDHTGPESGAIERGETGFSSAVSLTNLAGSVVSAMADPERWLRAAGQHLARVLAPLDDESAR